MSKWLILVPARYESSRFPGKPLSLIKNHPMISYVVNNCKASGFDYSVVTDNDEIEKYLKDNHHNVVRVDDDVTTGSERIALAYERFFKEKGYDYIINVQGDEPLLNGELISKIGLAHASSTKDIYTAIKARSSLELDYKNPNVVKCIKSSLDDSCLYFSRAQVPFDREEKEIMWFQHIGIYSYKVEARMKFVRLEPSHLEQIEKLEQLRALENGLSIGATTTNLKIIGVDTPADIKKVEEVL